MPLFKKENVTWIVMFQALYSLRIVSSRNTQKSSPWPVIKTRHRNLSCAFQEHNWVLIWQKGIRLSHGLSLDVAKFERVSNAFYFLGRSKPVYFVLIIAVVLRHLLWILDFGDRSLWRAKSVMSFSTAQNKAQTNLFQPPINLLYIL